MYIQMEDNIISYTVVESNYTEENKNLEYVLQEFENVSSEDSIIAQMKEYDENFTNKQLLLICEFYDLAKKMRTMKKQDIIATIMFFEGDVNNVEIVMKRKIFWGYMEELKNDKIMKRYIINW